MTFLHFYIHQQQFSSTIMFHMYRCPHAQSDSWLPDEWLCFHALNCSVLAKSFCLACAWYGLHASKSHISFMCQTESKQRHEGLFRVVCFSCLWVKTTWEAWGLTEDPAGDRGEEASPVALVDGEKRKGMFAGFIWLLREEHATCECTLNEFLTLSLPIAPILLLEQMSHSGAALKRHCLVQFKKAKV